MLFETLMALSRYNYCSLPTFIQYTFSLNRLASFKGAWAVSSTVSPSADISLTRLFLLDYYLFQPFVAICRFSFLQCRTRQARLLCAVENFSISFRFFSILIQLSSYPYLNLDIGGQSGLQQPATVASHTPVRLNERFMTFWSPLSELNELQVIGNDSLHCIWFKNTVVWHLMSPGSSWHLPWKSPFTLTFMFALEVYQGTAVTDCLNCRRLRTLS